MQRKTTSLVWLHHFFKNGPSWVGECDATSVDDSLNGQTNIDIDLLILLTEEKQMTVFSKMLNCCLTSESSCFYPFSHTHTHTGDPVSWLNDRTPHVHLMKRQIVYEKAVKHKLSTASDQKKKKKQLSCLTSCLSAALCLPLRRPPGAWIETRKDEYKLISCHKITHKNTQRNTHKQD